WRLESNGHIHIAAAVAAEIARIGRRQRIGLPFPRRVVHVAVRVESRRRGDEKWIVRGALRIQIEPPHVVAAGEATDAADVRVALIVDANARFDVLPGPERVNRAAVAERNAGFRPGHERCDTRGRYRNRLEADDAVIWIKRRDREEDDVNRERIVYSRGDN